jgi:hypothetical protein
VEYFLERIIRMVDEGQLQNKSWIHVLGTCELETAVCESRSNTTPLKRQNVFAAPEQNYGI